MHISHHLGAVRPDLCGSGANRRLGAVLAILACVGWLTNAGPVARWTLQAKVTEDPLEQVVFGNGVFIARGPHGVAVSSNGVQWAAQQPQGPDRDDPLVIVRQTLRGLVFGNGRFALSGEAWQLPRVQGATPYTLPILLGSADSIQWRDLRGEVVVGTDPLGTLGSLAFGNDRLVALDRRGVFHSGDGLDWEFAAGPAFAQVRFESGRFLAVGAAGALATSPDGWAWVQRESGTTSDLADLATDGSCVVAVGAGGTLLRSTDGAVWEALGSGTTQNLAAIAQGHHRWLVLGQRPNGLILRSTDGRSWSVELPKPHSGFFLPPLRFEGGRFWAVWQDAAWPVKGLLGSEDGSDWTWNWGEPHAGEIGLADFVAQPRLLVSVWLPGTGFPPGYAWNRPAISVTSWSDVGPDADYRFFSFDTELRSVAYGRNRFVTVGKAGVMFVSNDVAPVAPVLGIGFDPGNRRLRLELEAPRDREVRIEFSPDLAHWTSVGTYGSADSPISFDLPAGPAGASGFYRAAWE